MSDDKVFPDLFFSRKPLKEKINVMEFGEGAKQQRYFFLSIEKDTQDDRTGNYTGLAPYDDNDTEMIDCCDLEDNYEINPTKSGKFMTSFYLPSALHSVIIGPRGAKLRELQESTNTLIKVPRPNENDQIKITGPNERSVASARTQIFLLTLSKRENMPITHFLSIPVQSQEIRKNFLKFKDDILNGPPTRGIDGSIFQKFEKLHLTITTLTLLDDKEIEDVRNIMKTIVPDINSKLNLLKTTDITMEGVEIMNDDPRDVNVLYGKVHLRNKEETDKFQTLADEITDCFYKNGIIRKQYDNVKLHVTLMNSLFRKTSDDYERIEEKRGGKRETFDASYVLKKYQNYRFGCCPFANIHLSIRFTNNNGYYDNLIVV